MARIRLLLHRFGWRIRCWLSPIWPWRSSDLRRLWNKNLTELVDVNPHSPKFAFNHAILALVRRAGVTLPEEHVLTPDAAFDLVKHDLARRDPISEYDSKEVWHRISSIMTRRRGSVDAAVTTGGRPYRLNVKASRIDRHTIRIIISRGEDILTRDEVKNRYGLDAGQCV